MTAELTSRLAELDAKATPAPWPVAGLPTAYDNALVCEMRNALAALLNLVEAARAAMDASDAYWNAPSGRLVTACVETTDALRAALLALGEQRPQTGSVASAEALASSAGDS